VELEVQGNKKNIRVKEVYTSKSSDKRRAKMMEGDLSGSWTPEVSSDSNREYSFKARSNVDKMDVVKSPCTFFKRFKERHFP
jgi:hypothetical protein